MAANEIHENDLGTVFTVTITDNTSAVDISGATTKEITFLKPDKSVATVASSFTTDGTDGVIHYTSTASFLTPVGDWRMQAHIITASGNWHTDITNFTVSKNIST